jgi:chloramphenicol-sensitive protein RarD
MEQHGATRTPASPDGKQRPDLAGTLYTIGAFALWGILPLYWKLLDPVSAPEILAHRILWSAVFVGAVVLLTKRNVVRSILANRAQRRVVVGNALLIGVNWFTYIYAVGTEQLVEASMGYYINPLFSIFLGTVVLKERLGIWKGIAVALAAAGVVFMTLRHGELPWIALALTGSFGFYGLLKKTSNLDSLTSLGMETAFLSPAALVFIGVGLGQGSTAFGSAGLGIHVLLVLAGIATALPLYWFAQGAQRVPLSQVGFTQYLAPTMMLLIGVLLFGEPFTPTHAASFGLIWIALALYSLSHTRRMRDREARMRFGLRRALGRSTP